MSSDSLDLVWWIADVENPILTTEDLARVPPVTVARLVGQGVLRQTITATCITCDACGGDHTEEVMSIHYPDGKVRFFIWCPDNGRVEVEPERLQQWTLDYRPLLEALASSLSAQGTMVEAIPGRLWNLGRAPLAGKSKTVWVARGLIWPDVGQIASRLPSGRSHVLFFLGQPAHGDLLSLAPESVIELRSVMRLDDTLVVDVDAVVSQLTDIPKELAPKRVKKKSRRDATVGALKRELRERILSLKDGIRDADDTGRTLDFPPLTQKDLAKAIQVSESAVSRAIQQSGDHELKILLETVRDPDQVRKYHS